MEYFDVCDENGLPTGKVVSRQEAHEKGIRHRTAHIWVIQEMEGMTQVLLQKRSMNKDSFPGQLDTSAAGHILAGDEPAESAVRELEEELGIKAAPGDLEFAGQFRINYDKVFHGKPFRDSEVANVFIYGKPVDITDITIQQEELEEVGWYDLKETCRRCTEHDPAYCIPMGGLIVLMKALDMKVDDRRTDQINDYSHK